MTSCGVAGPATAPSTAPATATSTTAELALREVPGFLSDAGVSGSIERNDGCVYLRSGDTLYIPVFPEGQADWDGQTLTFDDQSVREGGEITFGGAVVTHAPGEGVRLPPGCDRSVPLILANEG